MGNEVLFVGPGEDEASGRVGGITLPFRELELYLLDKPQFEDRFSFIHLSGSNRLSLFLCYLLAGIKVIFDTRFHSISLHCTYRSMIFFAPFLLTANIIFGKSYTLRKFAGNFDHLFEGGNLVSKYLLSHLMSRASITFFETKYLVEWGENKEIPVGWWPNSRNLPLEKFQWQVQSDIPVVGQQTRRPKLIYIGTVSKEKGAFRLKALAKNIEEVDIIMYGPATNFVVKELLKDAPLNLIYKGKLDHGDVSKTIYNADALLLPSSWPAEGYPGVMIEAAQVGTPVICSHARGPKELINSITGLGSAANFDSFSEIRRLLPEVIVQGSIQERQKLVERAKIFDTENVLPSVLSRIFKDAHLC